MRHELSQPNRPNFLFLVVVFDIFILTIVYGLYGSSWVGQAGQELNLTQESPSEIFEMKRPVEVRIFNSPVQRCLIGQKSIAYAKLEVELKDLIAEHGVESVLLMIDKNAPVSKEREVLNIFRALQLKVYYVAEPVYNK